MKTVYKYVLNFTEEQFIDMHRDAKILCVQMQGGFICIWAQVDITEPKEERGFLLVGTGHKITRIGLEYIGTIQTEGGLVFHVFEF